MNVEEYQRMFRLEDTHWWFIARRNLLERALRRFPPATPADRERRFLDVGCGTGGTLDRLRRQGNVVGLDMEPLALAFCRERGFSELVQASATRLPFSDRTFDGVVALDVLEHIPDDSAAVREISRVLTPGGTFYVTVPAYQSLWSSHDVALMHQRRYTAPQIRALLTGGGLCMVHLTYTVSTLLPPVWLVRRLRREKANAPARADVAPTPAPLNTLLRAFLDLESDLALTTPLPFGLTILAIARKPA